MTTRHRRGGLAVGVLTVLALPLLAGCGGSDDPSTVSASSPSADSPSSASSDTASASTSTSVSPAGDSGDSGGGKVDLADPCTLLTAAEVGAALDATVGAGELTPADSTLGNASCIWNTGKGVLPFRSFQIAISTDDSIKVDGYSASKLYDDTIKQFSPTSADGIGDKAAFGDTMGFVLKGDAYMTTSVGFNGTTPAAKEALKTLTAKAAAKL